jgi:hypothetical protein
MDSMEQTSNGDCMPNTVLGALIAAGGPVLVRCAADREHLAQPACPNAAALSPPIFSGYSEVPVQVQVQVPKSSVVSGLVNCGCYTTNHGKRRCSKRSTTWIFSTGVSGYAHIRGGPARDRGWARHCDRPFRPCSRKMLQQQLDLKLRRELEHLLLHDARRTARCYRSSWCSFQKRYISPLPCPG